MSVAITITGAGKHEIEIRSFNAKADFRSRQITLLPNKAVEVQLELNVLDQSKPYIAVISIDKNPDLRKEIVGSYSNASILARK